jgi:hypothetical protein
MDCLYIRGFEKCKKKWLKKSNKQANIIFFLGGRSVDRHIRQVLNKRLSTNISSFFVVGLGEVCEKKGISTIFCFVSCWSNYLTLLLAYIFGTLQLTRQKKYRIKELLHRKKIGDANKKKSEKIAVDGG